MFQAIAQNLEYSFRDPYYEDYSLLASKLGSPELWKRGRVRRAPVMVGFAGFGG